MGSLPGGDGEYIMRKRIIVSLLIAVLSTLAFMSTGCSCYFCQPGKTPAEVNREHARTLQINQEQLMRDIDRTFDFDKPRTLTEMRVLP